MAKARKDKPEAATSEAQPSFEAIVGELESIVARLERGEQSLEVALADFEAGMALSRKATDVLDKAELRLARLTAGEGLDEEPLSPEGVRG